MRAAPSCLSAPSSGVSLTDTICTTGPLSAPDVTREHAQEGAPRARKHTLEQRKRAAKVATCGQVRAALQHVRVRQEDLCSARSLDAPAQLLLFFPSAAAN